MARFHVIYTFQISHRPLFILAGSIVEGVIRAGMIVRIPLNPSSAIGIPIHSIEFARRQGGEDTCLCFKVEPDEAELLKSLNLKDEILEITSDDSDERPEEI